MFTAVDCLNLNQAISCLICKYQLNIPTKHRYNNSKSRCHKQYLAQLWYTEIKQSDQKLQVK